jgi:hypothetical protein
VLRVVLTKGLRLVLGGIARATKGDVTPAGENFREMPRRLLLEKPEFAR